MVNSRPGQVLVLHGLVLAAGQSSRMGRDKALLEIEGVPLWRRQYELLGQLSTVRRLVSIRREQDWLPTGIEKVHDAEPGLGPLAGIAAAMAQCENATHLVVVAVDLPQLSVEWLQRLLTACSLNKGAIGRRSDGFFEPLAAIYPLSMRSKIDQHLREGNLSLQQLARAAIEAGELVACPIGPKEENWFKNWNEPDALNR